MKITRTRQLPPSFEFYTDTGKNILIRDSNKSEEELLAINWGKVIDFAIEIGKDIFGDDEPETPTGGGTGGGGSDGSSCVEITKGDVRVKIC